MKAEIKMRLAKRYLTIPKKVRDGYIDPVVEKIRYQVIGDSVQFVTTEGDSDLVARIDLDGWEMSNVGKRNLCDGRKIYIEKWREDLDIQSDEDGEYVLAEVSTTSGELDPPIKSQRDDLSYYEADDLIESFLEEKEPSYVRPARVVKWSGFEHNNSNTRVVSDVLSEKFEESELGSYKQFKVPKKA